MFESYGRIADADIDYNVPGITFRSDADQQSWGVHTCSVISSSLYHPTIWAGGDSDVQKVVKRRCDAYRITE